MTTAIKDTIPSTVTVTSIPAPDYLVGDLSLRSEIWTGPAVFTLVIAFLALSTSAMSVAWQVYTWRHDGALVKLRTFVIPEVSAVDTRENGGARVQIRQPEEFIVTATNKGRKEAHVGPVYLAKTEGRFNIRSASLDEHTSVQNAGQFPVLNHTPLELSPGTVDRDNARPCRDLVVLSTP